ncbi:beta-lactamase regulating signal transducer with metallopeptidase domain [Desulfitobacterium sp. LBE]|uniref:M56 family metallopeptidase n=1 Tax=Desulfitobacterium sp. LBE TaxID=884086 RepID=UPI00119A465F|nr:M56 family metallopeptidase [Desulfitobacterium sp. LBE]TWH57210.1 beta-lactamase regulating signal transducer with metallopeptidase domain [Desulfitobacterium sp. LBE]
MLGNILLVSLTLSPVIILLLMISPWLHKRYSAQWCYLVWLVLALRLIIPWRFELPNAPVNLPTPPQQTIMFQQDGRQGLFIGNGHLENSHNPPAAASGSTSTPVSAPGSASVSASVPDSVSTSSIAAADHTSVITLQELLLVVWALGAVSFFLFHLISYTRFRRKIRPYCRKTDSAVPDSVFESVLLDLKIKSRPQLLSCSEIASPMLTGFFKPAILLPDLEYTREELSLVLQHELTHYKRGDTWYKLLLLAANAVHWFNPLVYFMVKAANRDLEYSCDDLVVKNSDLSFRKEYSLTILKTMQNQQPPALSTGFSASGENARSRFANILDGQNKKRGIWALVLVLGLAAVSSTLVACNQVQASVNSLESANSQESNPVRLPGSYAENLYQYQGTDVDDKARVSALVQALQFTDLSVQSIEIKTDSEPYQITVNYQVGSRADYRFAQDTFTGLSRNAAVLFSLIPKADHISLNLYDEYGDFRRSPYSREDLDTYYGMDYFTADRVHEATDSLESFTNYLDHVAALKNAEEFYSEDKLIRKQNEEMMKQIYAVIGDDCELIATSFITNNPMNFRGTIPEAMAVSPEIQKLAEQNDLLAQYKDKEITFSVHISRNFKINGPYTNYLFAFDGERMIAYMEL